MATESCERDDMTPSRAHVDEFWRAGTEAGYRDDGAPGPRPQYSPDYYGGFLLDPDGNSAEAVHHGPGVHLHADSIGSAICIDQHKRQCDGLATECELDGHGGGATGNTLSCQPELCKSTRQHN